VTETTIGQMPGTLETPFALKRMPPAMLDSGYALCMKRIGGRLTPVGDPRGPFTIFSSISLKHACMHGERLSGT
jgi:hypothetical protein